MNLEQYKRFEGLTYRQLGLKIGGEEGCRVTESQVRAYCCGDRWPRPERMEVILKSCLGVTIDAMYVAHLKQVKSMIIEKGEGEKPHHAPPKLALVADGGQ